MTRKQMGLIFTLMALLVCVAVLSLKLNENGLKDETDLASLIVENNLDKDQDKKEETNTTDKTTETSSEKDTESKEDTAKDQKTSTTSTTTDAMYSLKSERDKSNATTVENLQAIINNSNSSQEQKDIATKELAAANKISDQQSRIEVNLKTLGYEDALCFIDGGKAKVYVKTDEQLTTSKLSSIREVVEDVASSITDVSVQTQK